MKPMLFILFFMMTISMISFSANAKSEINSTDEGVAIEGYDSVAYFTDGFAVKGKTEFKSEWNGAYWLFSNAEHRDLFDAAPEKYAPQYGGYCAYAASNKGIASGSPQRWRIVDDKLYLNTNLLAQKLWENNIPDNINSSDQNWSELKTKLKEQN